MPGTKGFPVTLPTPVSSSAILIYLSCRCQVGDHWYPPDLQSRARIHEYLGWHADNIRGTFGVTLWARVRRAIRGGLEPQGTNRKLESQIEFTIYPHRL